MRRRIGLVSILLCLVIGYCALTSGQSKPIACDNSAPDPCSYTALNGRCTITINRLSPVTPPTIYAKPNAVITVHVTNPSPLEQLSLDWKSTTAVVPPDVISAVFSGISGNLGKFTFSTTLKFTPEILAFDGGVYDRIGKAQDGLLKSIQDYTAIEKAAKPGLKSLRVALLPPPGDICVAPPKTQEDPWLETPAWGQYVIAALQAAKDATNIEEFDKSIKDCAQGEDCSAR